MTQTRSEGVFLKLVIDDTYWNVIFVCCKRKSHKNKLNMHRRFFPFYVAPLFHKTFIVVTLIILLGDAGNPKSLRARKGKLLSSRRQDLYSLLYLQNTFLYYKSNKIIDFLVKVRHVFHWLFVQIIE